jgi:predicted AlkP superfamily phosphohydrolase/phosphomutase
LGGNIVKIRFALEGKESVFKVESNDLKELVQQIEQEIRRIASEESHQIRNEQFLTSAVCEAVCNDAYSEEIDLGELGGI